jgi:regulator of protease activity HflC (stomatin/prohibitin superfamily)
MDTSLILTLLIPLILILYLALFFVVLISGNTFGRLLFDAEAHDTNTEAKRYVFVQHGVVTEDSSPWLRLMGGFGELWVDEDSVAVLEKFGRFTRVVGHGWHLLNRFERVRGAVDLRPQVRKSSAMGYTRDGIPVQFDAEFEFRIIAKSAEAAARAESASGLAKLLRRQREPFQPYTYTEDAVWKAVYLMPVSNDKGELAVWGDRVAMMAIGEIADFITSHAFDELSTAPSTGVTTRMDMSVRRRIQREAEVGATKILRNQGAELLNLRFSNFRFEEPEVQGVTDQRFEDWRAYWLREAQKVLSEGKIRALETHHEARAETHHKALTLLADTLKEIGLRHASTNQVLWLRVMEMLDHMAMDTRTYRSIPLEVFNMMQFLLTVTPPPSIPASSPAAAASAPQPPPQPPPGMRK